MLKPTSIGAFQSSLDSYALEVAQMSRLARTSYVSFWVEQPDFPGQPIGMPTGFFTIFSNIQNDYYTSEYIVSISDVSETVDDLEGSSTLGDVQITVIDYQQRITNFLATHTFEGRRAQLFFNDADTSGTRGSVLAWCGYVASVELTDPNTYTFTCRDTRLGVKKVIFASGDDGKPTSDQHSKILVGHPLDILVHILTTELGWQADGIDTATINAYRDNIFGGLNFLFTVTSPPDALEFIQQQLIKPLGGYLRVTPYVADTSIFGYTMAPNGKITVVFPGRPLGGSKIPIMTIGPDSLTEIPSLKQLDLMNTVSFRFDYDGSKYASEFVYSDPKSIAKYGLEGQHIIQADGVRAGYGGHSLARFVARSVAARYGDKNPTFTQSILGGGLPSPAGPYANWGGELNVGDPNGAIPNVPMFLEPGDYVFATHPEAPNRWDGGLGIADQLFQVRNRTWHFMQGTVELELVDARFLKDELVPDGSGGFTFGRVIAEDGVPDWTVASTLQKAKYMFISGADGKMSDGADGPLLI